MLKVAFELVDFTQLKSKDPDWEKTFADADKDTIAAKLIAMGFPPAKTASMAVAILAHMRWREEEVPSLLRRKFSASELYHLRSEIHDPAESPREEETPHLICELYLQYQL